MVWDISNQFMEQCPGHHKQKTYFKPTNKELHNHIMYIILKGGNILCLVLMVWISGYSGYMVEGMFNLAAGKRILTKKGKVRALSMPIQGKDPPNQSIYIPFHQMYLDADAAALKKIFIYKRYNLSEPISE